MARLDKALLKRLAAKYIWWKSPEDAVELPERVVAQVMNLGDYNDMQILAETVGEDYLRQVIEQAEPGIFSEKSWAYWHYRLRLAELEQVPPLPQRKFG